MPANREPPVAIDAEVSVLGALLTGGSETVGDVVDILEPEHFYREAHRGICRAVYAIYGRGEEPDPTSVPEQLRQTGELESVGGLAYLAELMGSVVTAASATYHARIVVDRARRRALIEAGTEIVRDGYESPDDADAIVDRAERRVMDVGRSASKAMLASLRDTLKPTLADIERRQNAPGGVTGVPTGFPDLDHMTGGLQPSDLVIVAARPSMGKTALVTSILLHGAVAERKTVALFSLEMSKEQITQRMLCSEGLVDIGRLLRGRLLDEDYAHLGHAAKVLNDAPIWIDESGDLSVMEIRAKARRLAMREEIGLVAVDYLQLMRGAGEENRNQEVSAISRGLKLLAKELHVPVIALSQLSRKVEDRSDKRPHLSDLRESGAIEQDADLVMFLYRPGVYATDGDPDVDHGAAELIIGKQRNGPIGTVHLRFRKECARFESQSLRERVAA